MLYWSPRSSIGASTASCHLRPDAKAIQRIQLENSKTEKGLIDNVAILNTVLVVYRSLFRIEVPLAIASLAECLLSVQSEVTRGCRGTVPIFDPLQMISA